MERKTGLCEMQDIFGNGLSSQRIQDGQIRLYHHLVVSVDGKRRFKLSIGHTYHFVIFQNIDIFFSLQHLLDLF